MATDWLGFDEFLGLQGDEIRRLEDEALARAQQAEGDAMGALGRAESEARTSGRALQQTASYTDFARAQTALRQTAMRRPATGRESAAAQAMGLSGAADTGGGERLAGAEAEAGARAQAGFEERRAADAAARKRAADEARAAQRRQERLQAWRDWQDANAAARTARTRAQGEWAKTPAGASSAPRPRTPEEIRAEQARKRFETFGQEDAAWSR